MSLVAAVLVAFVAVEHFGFMVLESFLWTTPTGRKVFRLSREKAEHTADLAKNQGVYNGFLAAGLVWGLVLQWQGAAHAADVQVFFLVCVVIAAIVGAVTAAREILVVQGLPAALALAAVLVG